MSDVIPRLLVQPPSSPGQWVNLIRNSSGRWGGFGWITSDPAVTIDRGPAGVWDNLEIVREGTSTGFTVTSEPRPIRYGEHAHVRGIVTHLDTSALVSVSLYFRNASGTVIASPNIPDIDETGLFQIGPTAAPSGAATVEVHIQYITPPGSDRVLRMQGLALAKDANPANLLGLTDTEVWQDVTDYANKITVQRSVLDVGTLTAVFNSASLDPAVNALLRPGARLRLVAGTYEDWTSEPAWASSLFTGTIRPSDTKYELLRRDPEKQAVVTITATDAATELANAPRPSGVATIAELPHILQGTGVPYECDESTSFSSSVPLTEVSRNDSASALDQVAITRDSVLGLAWVSAQGVLRAFTGYSEAAEYSLDESDYGPDIEIAYDTASIINSVLVTRLGFDTEGNPTETSYGPYEDAGSIDEWGKFEKTFTVHGLDESDIEDMAEAVLAANAQPQRLVKSLTIPSGVSKPVIGADLCDLIGIQNERAGLVENYQRITGISHTITATARGSRWVMGLEFASSDSVAQPTLAPPTTVAERPVLLPVGSVQLWMGAKADCPAGWLVLDGASFSGTDYPELATLLGSTTLPNFTDRVPVGAGSKSLKSTGGSPTVTLTAANLPPHVHAINHTHTISTRTNGTAGANTGRVAAAGGTGSTDDANTAVNTYTGNSGDGSTTSGLAGTPFSTLDPWLALWFIIRAKPLYR